MCTPVLVKEEGKAGMRKYSYVLLYGYEWHLTD